MLVPTLDHPGDQVEGKIPKALAPTTACVRLWTPRLRANSNLLARQNAESLRSCCGLCPTVDGESAGKLQSIGVVECREPEIVLWPVSDCGR